MTNLEALSMESGLRPAANQLENRQWQFGLQLLSLVQGKRARDVVGTGTEIGKWLGAALCYSWTETEKTILPEEPELLQAVLIQKEWKEAKKEAEKEWPGLVRFTDGSQQVEGTVGYAMAWKDGHSWKGIKTHMGYNQEAFDAECVALAQALETTA